MIIFIFLLQGVCWADWSISLPEKIEALSGSSVLIKCSFTINQTYEKYLTERANGLWNKDDYWSNTMMSKLSTNSIIKGNIIGNLKEKNCTTIFYDITSNYSGKYYFRIENGNDLKHTFTTPVTINVIDAPKISLSSCNTTNVTVCFCEADGNPSPKLEWRLSGHPVTDFSLMDMIVERLGNTSLRSSITLHHSLTHTLTLQCVSTNTHGNDTQEFTFTSSPQETADCQRVTISLLIILPLILLLYALTVVLALYKNRQLATKLKAERKADTNPSLRLCAPATDYENLKFKRGNKQ